MQTITTTFTCAAGGTAKGSDFRLFWMLVIAIAILDDSDCREKKQRRKRAQAAKRQTARPPGPR